MARYFSKARGAGVADPEAGEAVVLARFDEHEA
jgi:hypothetical protein